jgi:hypothetical protein
MAKQTAVQFLVMKYNQWQGVLKDRDIEEAKAIEKEQIKEGYIMSLLDGDNKIRRDAEQYYNDTYENNK